MSLLSEFSPWVALSNRRPIPRPGVYIIAPLSEIELGKTPSEIHALLYVGEACDQTISQRLSQFCRSAFRGLRAHSGGTRFNGFYQNADENEYAFSVLVSEHQEPTLSAYIRFVERAIIWEYVFQHNRFPPCNGK
jgi:hypothetical protein